jgi:hypothetical protein
MESNTKSNDDHNIKIDLDTVVFHYDKITTGRTRAEKNQANQFIVRFIASE